MEVLIKEESLYPACKTQGCRKIPVSSGFCNPCYQKQHRAKDPERNQRQCREYRARNLARIQEYDRKRSGRPRISPHFCSVEGCGERMLAKKLCMRHYAAASYRANPEKKRAMKRAWTQKNREKLADGKRDRHYRTTFGLTLEQYNAMLSSQGGVCKICGSDKPKGKKNSNFQVDHCHRTGKVRGLLCVPCNLGIGHLQDNPEVLRKAALYVEDNQS